MSKAPSVSDEHEVIIWSEARIVAGALRAKGWPRVLVRIESGTICPMYVRGESMAPEAKDA